MTRVVLSDNLTLEENLMLPALLERKPRAEVQKKAASLEPNRPRPPIHIKWTGCYSRRAVTSVRRSMGRPLRWTARRTASGVGASQRAPLAFGVKITRYSSGAALK